MKKIFSVNVFQNVRLFRDDVALNYFSIYITQVCKRVLGVLGVFGVNWTCFHAVHHG